jgi:hypothetical protein
MTLEPFITAGRNSSDHKSCTPSFAFIECDQ